ncbi:MAG: hypothetical protein ACTSO9_12460 [Candidatus Helarchaeota archaeon]
MIQNILILKRSGLSIYEKSFGISFDEDLISGFFSAFFSFTQKLWNANFQDILLGQYRILFEWLGEELILVAIFDHNDSIIGVQQKLFELKRYLESTPKYNDVIKQDLCDASTFQDLDKTIENIVKKPDIIVTINQFTQSRNILKEYMSNNEVLDIALLSIKGRPLFKPKSQEFLDIMIKQIDAFWKFKTKIVDQIILYYENRYIILLKIKNPNLDEVIFASLFERNIPIGLSSMIVEDVAKKLSKIK